jgi:galactokinase
MVHEEPPLAALLSRTVGRFEQRFGRRARWLALGPGRVNLIGEHIDYNDGFVLPMAIERYVVIAADTAAGRPGSSTLSGRTAVIASADQSPEAVIPCDVPMTRGQPAWANYVRGVMAGFQRQGAVVEGFDAYIDSDLPLGGGLSSSAALEVAAATLLEAVTREQLDPVEKALLCQKAEHEFAGVPCGIMDQFASVLGRKDHLLLLDCRSRRVEHVPLDDPGVTVLIINSQVRHELTGGEYALRRKQCEAAAAALGVASLRDATMGMLEARRAAMDGVVFRRARHVITETRRTVDAAASLRGGRWDAVGRLMYESHASLRDDFEVSCAELDAIVEIAAGLGEGVIGCRMTGGGFGGCAVCLVRTEHADDVKNQIARKYERRAGRTASLFTTRPARGARVIQEPG